MNLFSLLRAPLQNLALGLLRVGAWLFLRFETEHTRITITISQYVEADSDDEEAPRSPRGVDPTYVEWLNELYDNSPESDTRMG